MKKQLNPRWFKVIQYYVWNNVSKRELAKRTEVPYDTVIRWFKDVSFLREYERQYTESLTEKYIDCIKGMVREASAGNVAAFKEVRSIAEKVEHGNSRQLEPSKFLLQINNIGSNLDNIDEAEVVQDPTSDLKEVHIPKKVHMSPQEEKKRVEVIKSTYKTVKVIKEKRNALLRL